MSTEASLLPEYTTVHYTSIAPVASSLTSSSSSTSSSTSKSTSTSSSHSKNSSNEEEDESVYVFEIALSNASSSSSLSSSSVLAASTSDGSIKLFDSSTLTLLGNLSGHPNAPISRITFAHSNPFVLFSAGLDGFVHSWDIRDPTASPVVSFKSSIKKIHFASMDVSCNDSFVVAGGEQIQEDQGPVLIWDTRNANTVFHAFTESHTDDVASIECHPEIPTRFVTGSEDNLVCLFDLNANMSQEVPSDMVIEDEITPEENATVSVMNAESSVHKVGFFGPHGEYIFTQTGSQTLKLYQGEQAHQLASFPLIREQINDYFINAGSSMHIDYLIDSKYCSSTQRLFLIGGDFSGNAHILHVSLSGFQYVRSLSGSHSSTVRSINWEQDLQTAYTGGEDSLLCLWKAVSE